MLRLDPYLRLRRGESNIYCHSIDRLAATISRQKLLHPIEAVVLSLFNGRRSEADVAKILCDITDSTEEEGRRFLANCMSKLRECLTEGGVDDRYNPIDFAMSPDEIDMSSFRLISPLALTMILTYRCSSNCRYCYANRNSLEDAEEMDLEFASYIVDQAEQCGVELLYVGGGDPFVKRWVVDLLRHICSKKITPIVSTKERVSVDECCRLADGGLLNMQVSIDTLDGPTADFLTGRRDFVADALATIDNLLSAGVEVTTNSVVTAANVRQVPELVSFLIDKGVKSIVLSRYYRSSFIHSDRLFVEDSDIDLLNEGLSRVVIPDSVSLSGPKNEIPKSGDDQLQDFLNRAACAFGRIGVVISPSGKVLPCEQLPTEPPFVLGDLRQQTLQQVWESKALLAALYPDRSHFQGTQCYDCEHFDRCIHDRGWCMRDIYKVHGTAIGTQPACPKSAHRVRLS